MGVVMINFYFRAMCYDSCGHLQPVTNPDDIAPLRQQSTEILSNPYPLLGISVTVFVIGQWKEEVHGEKVELENLAYTMAVRTKSCVAA